MYCYIGPFIEDKELAIAMAVPRAVRPPLDDKDQWPVQTVDLTPPFLADPLAPGVNLGFFVTESSLSGAEYRLLGTRLDDALPASEWEMVFGYSPAAARVGDAVAEALTVRADPFGQTAPKPLMFRMFNGTAWDVSLQLAGVPIFSRKLDPNGTALQQIDFANALAVRKEDYRAVREIELEKDSDVYLKALTAWGEELRITNPEDVIIPDDLPKEEPKPRETTYTDDFNRASLGSDWLFIDGDAGVGTIVSNQYRVGDGSANYSRKKYDHALSSDNHLAQFTEAAFSGATVGGEQMTVMTRLNASTGSYLANYSLHHGYAGSGNYTLTVGKWVSPTFTSLANHGNFAPTGTPKQQINGSNGESFYSGSSAGTWTDSAITGYLYCGIQGVSSAGLTATLDNFTLTDVADLTAVIVPTTINGLATAGGVIIPPCVRPTSINSTAVIGTPIILREQNQFGGVDRRRQLLLP